MGRRIGGIGVAAIVAASIWVAPGAQAAEAEDCQLGSPPEGTFVTIGPGQIDVYPENVGPYADAVAGWAGAYVNCLWAQNQRWIDCVPNHLAANQPTVTVDPETGHVTIKYGDLLTPAC